MIVHLQLLVQSTGEVIREADTSYTAIRWERGTIRKLLRRRSLAGRFREAIESGDVITGWSNYDAMNATLARADIRKINRYVFRGYGERR